MCPPPTPPPPHTGGSWTVWGREGLVSLCPSLGPAPSDLQEARLLPHPPPIQLQPSGPQAELTTLPCSLCLWEGSRPSASHQGAQSSLRNVPSDFPTCPCGPHSCRNCCLPSQAAAPSGWVSRPTALSTGMSPPCLSKATCPSRPKVTAPSSSRQSSQPIGPSLLLPPRLLARAAPWGAPDTHQWAVL